MLLDFNAFSRLIRPMSLNIRFLFVRLRFCYCFFSPIPHDMNLASRFRVRRKLRPLWTFTTDERHARHTKETPEPAFAGSGVSLSETYFTASKKFSFFTYYAGTIVSSAPAVSISSLFLRSLLQSLHSHSHSFQILHYQSAPLPFQYCVPAQTLILHKFYP